MRSMLWSQDEGRASCTSRLLATYWLGIGGEVHVCLANPFPELEHHFWGPTQLVDVFWSPGRGRGGLHAPVSLRHHTVPKPVREASLVSLLTSVDSSENAFSERQPLWLRWLISACLTGASTANTVTERLNLIGKHNVWDDRVTRIPNEYSLTLMTCLPYFRVHELFSKFSVRISISVFARQVGMDISWMTCFLAREHRSKLPSYPDTTSQHTSWRHLWC